MKGVRRGRGLITDRDSDSQGLPRALLKHLVVQKCGKSDHGGCRFQFYHSFTTAEKPCAARVFAICCGVVFPILFFYKIKKEIIIIYIRTQRKYHTVFLPQGLAQRQCEPIRSMNRQHSPAREEGVMHRFVIPYSWSHRQSCRRFFYYAAGHCTERGERK